MKKISEHLGEIIVALAGIALIIGCIVMFSAPIGSFFSKIITTETSTGADVLNDIKVGDMDFFSTLPSDTDTMIYRLSSLDSNITYTNFEITSSNRAKIGYTGVENENLVIPVAFKDTDGKWYKVIGIGNGLSRSQGAFSKCTNLASVTLPDTVTSIGAYAFDECTNLTSITIPNNVTRIGSYAFSGCRGLESITIPNNVTNIAGYAFLDCSGLESITIPNGVTSIGSNAFHDCSGLESITIPNSVTRIEGYAFYGCSSLESITIPNNVTSIGSSAFSGCTGLTSITFEGTKAQWNNITKDTNWNNATGDYTVHCTDGDIAKS